MIVDFYITFIHSLLIIQLSALSRLDITQYLSLIKLFSFY